MQKRATAASRSFPPEPDIERRPHALVVPNAGQIASMRMLSGEKPPTAAPPVATVVMDYFARMKRRASSDAHGYETLASGSPKMGAESAYLALPLRRHVYNTAAGCHEVSARAGCRRMLLRPSNHCSRNPQSSRSRSKESSRRSEDYGVHRHRPHDGTSWKSCDEDLGSATGSLGTGLTRKSSEQGHEPGSG